MGVWAERVVPRLTDAALDNAEIGELRSVACLGLHGRVLEIGFGSGLNLPHCPPGVASVSEGERTDAAWARARRRRADSAVPVERIGLDGQRIEAEDASYDAALSTFTLCTIPDAAAALAEICRVLRPGGMFHFLEHGLAPDAPVAVWQRRLDPLQGLVFAGCHLTRDMPALVVDAGLEMTLLEQRYLPGPRIGRPWTYGYLGRAVRPA